MDILLLYPPVSKPAQPPAGIAQLKRAVEGYGFSCATIDANVEGLHYVLQSDISATTPRLHSALKNRDRNLQWIRELSTYNSFDRYKAAVLELNRLLMASAEPFNAAVSFTDFQHNKLRPVRQEDLYAAAEHPEINPFFDYFETVLRPKIEDASPRFIGISLIYLSQALTTFALLGWLRSRFPGIKLILGGGLVTSWLSQPNNKNLFDGWADQVVAGRGERAVLDVLGIEPDSSYFSPDYSDFSASYFSPLPIVPYSTSSGCYWRRCVFCPETAEGNAYDPVPHDKVFQDLELISPQQPFLLHFLDNALRPALLKKMTQRILPPWYGYVRFATELEDVDFCLALRHSGCVMLQLGLESGDQTVLDGMKKGIELDRVSRILTNLKKAGIATYVYLLFGTPWETETEARATLNFVAQHAETIDFINPAIFNLPAFSDEADNHRTRPFYAGDLSLYHDFEHPQGWHRARVRQFLQKEFKTQPAIKKILQANPPYFTSNHAPFFTPAFLAHEEIYEREIAV